jgi:hypothetical protein
MNLAMAAIFSVIRYGVPVRLLLLSRRGGEGWFDLVEGAHAGELMDSQELGLTGLAAAEPERVFFGSLRHLAEHFDRPVPSVGTDAVRGWVALSPTLHGLPLLLTAAAVHAFLHPDASLGFSGASIVKALADREQARLGNAARAVGLADKAAARIVALAGVTGSLDATALRRLADPKLEIGLPLPEKVVDAVSRLSWWQGYRVLPPEPDLMAAAFLVKILSERPDKAPEWLWVVIENAIGPQLVDRLGRLALDAVTVNGFCARDHGASTEYRIE